MVGVDFEHPDFEMRIYFGKMTSPCDLKRVASCRRFTPSVRLLRLEGLCDQSIYPG